MNAKLVFHRDVRCLFEVGISKIMFAQVGLLVHALSTLNFDGLYILHAPASNNVLHFITNNEEKEFLKLYYIELYL